MRIFLTGATGYIGGTVAEALLGAGYQVAGLARNAARAAQMREKGIEPLEGDLYNPDTVVSGAASCDAAIHTALGHDPNAPIADRAATEAVLAAYAGTGKPFLYTSGVWVMGNTQPDAAEDSPLAAPPFVAWRMDTEQTVLDAARRGVRSVVLRPAMVYGRGGGLVMMFVKSARETGAALMVGDGENYWSFVHVDDLADLYLLALRDAQPGTLIIAASGKPHKVKDVAAAASEAVGGGGKVHSLNLDEAFSTMGPWAQGLVLNSRVSGARAQKLLGWKPSRPDVMDELRGGPDRQPANP